MKRRALSSRSSQPPTTDATVLGLGVFDAAAYPAALVDYVWVMFVYITLGYMMAVLIDGYILPAYDAKRENSKCTARLYAEVVGQLTVQGYLCVLIIAGLQHLPTPAEGISGYTKKSTLGTLVRNPAIITSLLLALSSSLRSKMFLVFDRLGPRKS